MKVNCNACPIVDYCKVKKSFDGEKLTPDTDAKCKLVLACDFGTLYD